MPLRRAVKRLELAQQDLDQSDADPARGRGTCRATTRRPTSRAAGETRGRGGRAARPDRRASGSAGRSASSQRLKRRVRGEWQEKLLALRLAGPARPTAVKILETAVLWLILILTVLIVAEALLERAPDGSPTPTAPGSPGPTWRSARCCSSSSCSSSALAPRKGLYFLRHLVIDFLASLPFGFCRTRSSSPRLDDGLERAGEALRLLRFLRIGRLVQMLRLRPAGPAGRPAGAGRALPAAAAATAWSAGMAGCSIATSCSSSRSTPRSPSRATAIACRPAERAGARRGRSSRRGSIAISAGGSRRRILADLDMPDRGLCRPERSTESETREGLDGREIPVEAVVERLIQMTPERLRRPDGAGVRDRRRPLSPAPRPAPAPPAARRSQPGRLPREEPGRSRGPRRQLPGPPDPARARRRLLPRRPARHALAAGLSRPPGCDDRQRHAHAGQAAALAGLGVSLPVPDRQRRRRSWSRSGRSSTSSRP